MAGGSVNAGGTAILGVSLLGVSLRGVSIRGAGIAGFVGVGGKRESCSGSARALGAGWLCWDWPGLSSLGC